MKKIILVAGILLASSVGINYAGKGILLGERIVYTNEDFPMEIQSEHGLRNDSKNPVLVCKYLMGVSWRYRVYWQSNNGVLGRINCPNFADVPR